LTFLILFQIITGFTEFHHSKLVYAITYIIYFIFLSTEVYGQIIKTKEVTASVISAVLCGFIILGVLGGYSFVIVEFFQPVSFNNIGTGTHGITDLMYFSFITILSVGYGDVTPATEVAKKTAVLFGLIGHFYSVVVIGIIIGKYISKSE
jgi:voltage-gated potassium channel